MSETIIIACLSFLGTLAGAYFSNKKSTALIAYRLEQLENKVNKHNEVIERTYELEKLTELQEFEIRSNAEHIKNIEKELHHGNS